MFLPPSLFLRPLRCVLASLVPGSKVFFVGERFGGSGFLYLFGAALQFCFPLSSVNGFVLFRYTTLCSARNITRI